MKILEILKELPKKWNESRSGSKGDERRINNKKWSQVCVCCLAADHSLVRFAGCALCRACPMAIHHTTTGL